MSDLIKALKIFLKYGDPINPTKCELNLLTVCIDPRVVEKVDILALELLGFSSDLERDGFVSDRFGSG